MHNDFLPKIASARSSPGKQNSEPYWHCLFSTYVLTVSLPEQLVSSLTEVTDEIVSDLATARKFDYSDNLAGRVRAGVQVQLSLRDQVAPSSAWNKDRAVLIPFLERVANCYINRVACEDPRARAYFLDKKLSVSDMWVVSQRAGDYNPLHSHPALLSGVLYLKVPPQICEDTIPDGFLTFTMGDLYDPYKLQLNLHRDFKPTVGILHLFPSWLPHQVYPFRGEGERRCISFNIIALAA